MGRSRWRFRRAPRWRLPLLLGLGAFGGAMRCGARAGPRRPWRAWPCSTGAWVSSSARAADSRRRPRHGLRRPRLLARLGGCLRLGSRCEMMRGPKNNTAKNSLGLALVELPSESLETIKGRALAFALVPLALFKGLEPRALHAVALRAPFLERPRGLLRPRALGAGLAVVVAFACAFALAVALGLVLVLAHQASAVAFGPPVGLGVLGGASRRLDGFRLGEERAVGALRRVVARAGRVSAAGRRRGARRAPRPPARARLVAGAHPSAGAAVHSSAAPASAASPQRSSIGGAAAAAAFGARAPACAGRALRRCSNLRSSADSVGDAVATFFLAARRARFDAVSVAASSMKKRLASGCARAASPSRAAATASPTARSRRWRWRLVDGILCES